MENNISLGRVRGIPIEVHYSWLLVFGLVTVTLATGYFPGEYAGAGRLAYWLMALAASVLFFGSVLFHELSHSLVALENGIRIRRITLFIFGGLAQLEAEPRRPGSEFRIAIAGPMASLLLALVFRLLWLLTRAMGLWAETWVVLEYLYRINLLLALFNLVPAFPLDGGRVLRAGLWALTGDLRKATGAASGVGGAFAVLLMAWGMALALVGRVLDGLWLLFIGWFLLQTSQAGYYNVALRRALSGVLVRDVMTREVHRVSPELSIRRLVDDYFYRYRHTAFPVTGPDNLLTGVISVHDVKTVPAERWGQVTVAEIAPPLDRRQLIAPDAEVLEAFTRMAETRVGRLMVVEDGRLVGIITRAEIIALLRLRMDLEG